MIGSILWFSLGICCMFLLANIIKKIVQAIKITKKGFHVGVIDTQKYVFQLLWKKILYFVHTLLDIFRFEESGESINEAEELPKDKDRHLKIVKKK